MIATGTDIKALECVMFMRDVKSQAYYEQMKGRGTRVISIDELHKVTPDAPGKSRFVLVDCVGVTETDKTETKSLETKPSVSTAKLMEQVARGDRHSETLRALGNRMIRLDLKFNEQQRKRVNDLIKALNLLLPEGEGRGEGALEIKDPAPDYLIDNARELRKNQTDAESLLWQLLRNRQIENTKFRRQHPMDPYILDFYCHDKKMAVELDGGQHNSDEGKEKDKKRTEFLESKGIRVLRFWNNDVLQKTEAVLEEIYNALLPHPEPPVSGDEQWTKSNRVLLFEVINNLNEITLKLIIGPGFKDFREGLFKSVSSESKIFKGKLKSLYGKWTQIYKRKIVTKEQMDYDLDSIKGLITQELNDFFYHGDFEKLNTFFDGKFGIEDTES